MSVFFIFLYLSFTIVVLVIIVSYLIPSESILYALKTISELLKILFKKENEVIRSNIRKTFLLHQPYRIPSKSINIWHPHAVSGLTPVIHNGYCITNDTYKQTKGVAMSAFFLFPILRDVLRFMNAIPSDYETMKHVLETESISLTIGGIDEMLRTTNKSFDLVISKRKGIFRLALETGTPIVPILTYGENELFPETKSTILKQFNRYLYNITRISFPFPSLQSLQNWLKLSIKPLDPVNSYTGKPIYVKKIDNPSEKHIVKLRNIYIQRLRDLFEETNIYGYSLKII